MRIGLPSTISAGGLRLLASAAFVAGGLGVAQAASGTSRIPATPEWSAATLGTIDPKVFHLAIDAAQCAATLGAVHDPSTLTVIDYSRPSTAPRLWVYDLKDRTRLFEELVAHGQGSGGDVPTYFSNEADTHASSLGLFVTAGTFTGHDGYSLLLDGLETGFNDHARARGIIMHGAWYVSEVFAKAQGYLGRSWGCPAVSQRVAKTLIDRVKGGSLLFAYYPDQKWLSTSKYLGGCAAAHS